MISFIIRTGQLMFWAHVLIITTLGWTILVKDVQKIIRRKKEAKLSWHMRVVQHIKEKLA